MDIEFVRKRIEHLRTTDGVSKRNMSTALEQSESYISNITTGKSIPSLPALFEICDYFNISLKDFFDEDINHPFPLEQAIRILQTLDDADLEAIIYIASRLQSTHD